MGNEIDIFNPTVTKVVEGIQGKMILVHSAERKVGKTLEASHMPKPYYLRFEQGANAINGLPYAALTSWVDFKKVNKQQRRIDDYVQALDDIAQRANMVKEPPSLKPDWCPLKEV